MCTPGTPGRIPVQGQRAHPGSIERQSLVFAPAVKLERGRLFTDHDSTAQLMRAAIHHRARLLAKSFGVVSRLRDEGGFTLPKQRERTRAFTLIELLVVVSIIALLLVLIAPAFTYIKGGTDVTSAAYTIKGVLDTARTYAKANNTYTWVGFFEEDVPPPSENPAPSGTGRVVMSIVASKDGTMLYTGNLASSFILDAPPNQAALLQVGKLVEIDNVHLKTFPAATATLPPDTFDTRPAVASTASQIGDTAPPTPYLQFNYPVGSSSPQYTFTKIVQFSPRGEGVIDNNNYSLASVSEIGLQPTHGTTVDTNSTNFVAIQFTGIGGNVKIYRK